MERSARDALTTPYRGCTVYLPLMLVTVVHARRRRVVERAFLPRYLFVLDEGQGLPVIRTAPGVSHVVRNAGGVVMVAQRWIDEIRKRERPNREGKLFVDLEPEHEPCQVTYRPNEMIRVTDGPFASFNGLFRRDLKSDRRAAIAVNIFGRWNDVELGYNQFEKL